MNDNRQTEALAAAVKAARQAGDLMRRNLRGAKVVKETHRHDIKLELDVRCQSVIEHTLRRALPDAALLGEEGTTGDPEAATRWVVDPIDGTVNFAYGIPHACVSIALQERTSGTVAPRGKSPGYCTTLGVIYDPFTHELWTARRGQAARLNGRRVGVSTRGQLDQAMLALGVSKGRKVINTVAENFARLVHRVRKIRLMGSAALTLAYIASGRMDLYLESGLRLWDIAAGGLMVECAGGRFDARPAGPDHRYWMLAGNGRLEDKLLRCLKRPA